MKFFDHEMETADDIIDFIERMIAVQRSSESDEMGILPTETLGLIRALVLESQPGVWSAPVTDALRRMKEVNAALESAFISEGRLNPYVGILP